MIIEADILTYVPHKGTIRISGSTPPKRAAGCAMHFLLAGVKDIEFLYIGANAGQQAMKAMGTFRYVLEKMTENELTILYQPERVKTKIEGEEGYKDAVYWRVYVLTKKALESIGSSPLPSLPSSDEVENL